MQSFYAMQWRPVSYASLPMPMALSLSQVSVHLDALTIVRLPLPWGLLLLHATCTNRSTICWCAAVRLANCTNALALAGTPNLHMRLQSTC